MASELHAFEAWVAEQAGELNATAAAELRQWCEARALWTPTSDALMPKTAISPLLFTAIMTLIGDQCRFSAQVAAAADPERRLWPVVVKLYETRPKEVKNALVSAAADLLYVTSRPERYELFNHLSAGELFFIEGDSLLAEFLCNRNVRWDQTQPLHVVYLIEKFLSALRKRGGNFHIIFFAAHRAFWGSRPQFAAIREALIHRLGAVADNNGFTVDEFPNWWAPSDDETESFVDFMKRVQPEFVLCNDAEQFVPAPNVSIIEDPSAKEPLLIDGQNAAAALRLFASFCLAQRTHVAFSSRLFWKDNGILAFVIRALSSRFVPLNVMLTEITDCAQEALAALPPVSLKIAKDIRTLPNDLSTLDDDAGLKLSARDFAVVPAIAAAVKADPALAPWAKIHIASLAAARALPLNVRAMKPVKCAEVRAYLESFATAAVPFIAKVTNVMDIDEKFTDLYDGNLIATIGLMVQGKPVAEFFAEGSAAFMDALWKFIAGASGVDAAFGAAFPALASAKFTEADVRTVNPGAAVANNSIANELITKLLADCPSVLPACGNAPAPAAWMAEQNSLTELDVPPGVEKQDEELARLGSLEPRERRKVVKLENDFVMTMQKTAQSLKVEPFLKPNELRCLVVDEVSKEKKDRPKHSQEAKGKKKAMSQADRIKLANTINSLKTTAESFYNQLLAVTGNHKLEDLHDHMVALDRFIDECGKQKKKAPEEGPHPASLKAWRVLSGNDEFNFAVPTTQGMVKRQLNILTSFQAVDDFVAKQALLKEDAVLEGIDDDSQQAVKATLFKYFWDHLTCQTILSALRLAMEFFKVEVGNAKMDARHVEMKKAVFMFQRIQQLVNHIESTKIRMTHEDRHTLRAAVALLGFGDAYAKLIDGIDTEVCGQPFVATKSVEPVDKPTFDEPHNITRFQMTVMGHLLPRPRSKATKEERVPFAPDPWQLELLDIVDGNGSAVVCAPTSAGKTFISYYCMKKVLRESNDNVVVYVCPTRALINQAMSDVYGRYGQKSYDNEFRVLGCLGGAEFVRYPFKCQVLVTLPETFEGLLMSAKYQGWAKKIKYVIFDEIHSIENSGNGDVWERLLMLIRCPFVALSATLGSTNEVVSWLQRVQDKLAIQEAAPDRDYTVHMVPKGNTKINRWSDIQKYAYLSTSAEPFRTTKVAKNQSSAALMQIHPMSCVTIDMLCEKFPEDLPFVPSETVDLFDKMISHMGKYDLSKYAESPLVKHLTRRLHELKPERYFKGKRLITQAEARQLESDVKSLLQLWGRMTSGTFEFTLTQLKSKIDFLQASVVECDSDDAKAAIADKVKALKAELAELTEELSAATPSQKLVRKTMKVVVRELLATYGNVVKDAEAAIETEAKAGTGVAFPDTTSYVHQNIIPLLMTLKARELLPTLVFSFEESECANLVEHVVGTLEDAEAEFRKTKEFREYEASMKSRREEQEKARARQQKGGGKTKEVGEDGKVHVIENDNATTDFDKNYDIPDVLPQFSFRGTLSVVSQEEMADMEYDFKKDPLVWRAFQRGIGIHTPAVKGRLRVHIERMFRQAMLPLVFATEGLALGVHSPCRSVVLASDHVYLNTIQFRQMAGRAGRRGLDFLGHVVFLGVAYSKIQRLMTSDMNKLTGHVHIDPITELRMLQLHRESPTEKDKILAHRLADCLLTEPLFVQGRKNCDYAALLSQHMRSMFDLFSREGLFADEGRSLGALAARAMNTYQEAKAGSSAIAFAALLSSGALHRMTELWADESPDTRNVVVDSLQETLAYFFTIDTQFGTPLEVHRSVLRDPTVFLPQFPDRQPGVPHGVVLNSLRKLGGGEFMRHLKRYNQQVIDTLTKLMIGLGKQLDTEDSQLPLASGKAVPCAKKAGADPIVASCDARAIKPTARSPFVALAGLGDAFINTDDLVQSLRKGLFLDSAHVPTVDFTDLGRHDGSQILINACLPDWLDNGSQYVDGAPRRLHLWQYNGLKEDKSWYTLRRFSVVMDNMYRQMEKIVAKDVQERDTALQSLREVMAELEDRITEIQFKFADANKYNEAKRQQEEERKKANKKPLRPALAREVRRRRF